MGGIRTAQIPAPPTLDVKALPEFGAQVYGYDPTAPFDPAAFAELEELLYKHSLLVIRGVDLTPKQQYKLTKAFDATAEGSYGHGNNKTGSEKKSVLHPDLKTVPSQPQVQLIGNGVPTDPRITQGLDKPQLRHPHHKTFHKEVVSPEEEAQGITRFYRWHIDAALYDLLPPKVTTLYALSVPAGEEQTCRYDDGTGDELKVPLGTTAFVSGTKMFDILPPDLKSLAVRAKVRYAPHPYVWMAPAKSNSTGLGIVSDGKELSKDDLPAWESSKIKEFPMTWKNPKTGKLHYQVHPSGAEAIIVAPLPAGVDPSGQILPEGGIISDLKETRELLFKMQRPGIAPELVYPHDWKKDDLCIFHNRGVLHSVVGAFEPDQVRAFWQCNLASGEEPLPPTADDVKTYSSFA
ncbi:uncharacterized protein L969DRAFT_50251 [Mixia osmundae IAM 14324]|uniref:TauD/TfdA-like domain-containing protein n=1 Tax=Mixia osmundae (strain CBS 9802 / IAM 14324 / JCM 22182 / KY 12970) TaxID=764103 RepID=G7E6R1_MIXOS|nr:uncharacterized protein L969DRAFT_50251 [Mixia osmundae IAM 14324]KEI39097.1 hypothetical protein L969DRAFT_50251 [Mixia osmundae IAM 14324]GAA98521.1 hypothetical protein E5Q_05207 [Mixia osmundae IAM 14324]